MRSLLHEPLLHFLLLGAALFVADGFVNRAPKVQPGEIIVSAGQIEHFAARFAQFRQRLARLQTGAWSGPIRSGYGVHLVLLTARTESRLPALDEVRELVKRDVMRERRLEANRRLLDGLLAQYTVKVAWPKADVVSADKTLAHTP